jgi:uncharacterized protein (DUF2062 family)
MSKIIKTSDEEIKELKSYLKVKNFFKSLLPYFIYNFFKRQLKNIAHAEMPAWKIALSTSVGAFFGLIPTLWLSFFGAATIVWLMRGSFLAMFFGLILTSIPFVEYAVYPLSYEIGSKILGKTADISFFLQNLKEFNIMPILIPYAIGAIITGLIVGFILFLIIYYLINFYRFKLLVKYKKRIEEKGEGKKGLMESLKSSFSEYKKKETQD